MNIKDFNFDLKQVRAFIEVVNEKSFTNASRNLKVSQASISHQIGQIEKMLGVRLIHRNSQDFSLTAEGTIFHSFCKNTMKSIEHLKSEIVDGTFGGVVRLIASSIPGTYILPKMISECGISGEDSFFQIEIGNSREAIEKIKNGDADIAIAGRNIKHSALKFRKIIRDEIVLAAPADFSENLAVDDLKSIPFIIRESGSGTRNETENYLNSLNIHPSELNSVMECSTSEGVREAVINGIGLAFISKSAIEKDLALGKIKVIENDDFKIERYFYLVTSTIRSLHGPAKLFAEYIEDHFGVGEN